MSGLRQRLVIEPKGNQGESEASAKSELGARGGCNSRFGLISFSPLFARNTQKITPVLRAMVTCESDNTTEL